MSEAQDVLRSAGEFCDGYVAIIAMHQKILEEIVEKSMPAKDIEREKCAVEEGKQAERDSMEDVGRLKEWADRLEAEVNAES